MVMADLAEEGYWRSPDGGTGGDGGAPGSGDRGRSICGRQRRFRWQWNTGGAGGSANGGVNGKKGLMRETWNPRKS